MPSKKHDKEEKKKHLILSLNSGISEKISHLFGKNKTICMAYSEINKLNKYIRI